MVLRLYLFLTLIENATGLPFGTVCARLSTKEPNDESLNNNVAITVAIVGIISLGFLAAVCFVGRRNFSVVSSRILQHPIFSFTPTSPSQPPGSETIIIPLPTLEGGTPQDEPAPPYSKQLRSEEYVIQSSPSSNHTAGNSPLPRESITDVESLRCHSPVNSLLSEVASFRTLAPLPPSYSPDQGVDDAH